MISACKNGTESKVGEHDNCHVHQIVGYQNCSQKFLGLGYEFQQGLSPTGKLSRALEITHGASGDDKEMLEGILKFGDTTASEIMTPRVDITWLDQDMDFDKVGYQNCSQKFLGLGYEFQQGLSPTGTFEVLALGGREGKTCYFASADKTREKKAYYHANSSIANPYGDGHACGRIADFLLANVKMSGNASAISRIARHTLSMPSPKFSRRWPHGDTSTSTAAALAAFYARIPVGHVEAGLRTGDIYSRLAKQRTRGAIFMASGRVPKTSITFIGRGAGIVISDSGWREIRIRIVWWPATRQISHI